MTDRADEIYTELRAESYDPEKWVTMIEGAAQCIANLEAEVEGLETALKKVSQYAGRLESEVERLSGWVSVGERLPEEHVVILAYSKAWGIEFSELNNANDGIEMGLYPGEFATHWMPLPSPPEDATHEM